MTEVSDILTIIFQVLVGCVMLLVAIIWPVAMVARRNLMGKRENKVETYLDGEVMKIGGITRKWVSPGCPGVPDRLVFRRGRTWLVEVKTPDGSLEPSQKREITRLNAHGITVHVLYGRNDVDTFIECIRHEGD